MGKSVKFRVLHVLRFSAWPRCGTRRIFVERVRLASEASERIRPQLAPASAGAFCFRFLQGGRVEKCKTWTTQNFTEFPTLRHVVGISRWCSQRMCLRRPVPNGERPKQARHFGLDIRVSGPSFLPVTQENVDSTNHDMQRMPSFFLPTMAHGRTNAFGLRLR